jgi:hypothetical protein
VALEGYGSGVLLSSISLPHADCLTFFLIGNSEAQAHTTANDNDNNDKVNNDNDETNSKPTSDSVADYRQSLFDPNYNEESDADWASGGEWDTESEGSSEPELLSEAFRLEGDVDVEESEEETEYTIRKLTGGRRNK